MLFRSDDPLRVKSLMLPGRYKVSTWRDIGAIPWKDDFWVSGDFTPDDPLDHGWRTLERCEFEHYLTGVRFDPEPIVDFCKRSQSPLADLAPQTEPAKRSPGGRPPKPFWDQLWASIGASLYNGDLQPKRQADIENAMHDWLTFHGENAGETTVRAKAKQIWDAIQKEV